MTQCSMAKDVAADVADVADDATQQKRRRGRPRKHTHEHAAALAANALSKHVAAELERGIKRKTLRLHIADIERLTDIATDRNISRARVISLALDALELAN